MSKIGSEQGSDNLSNSIAGIQGASIGNRGPDKEAKGGKAGRGGQIKDGAQPDLCHCASMESKDKEYD